MEAGLRYVYLGNVRTEDGSTTFCPGCGQAVIRRDGYHVTKLRMIDRTCGFCGTPIPGQFVS
jgi:pyruvate formate lyase activating enzyme